MRRLLLASLAALALAAPLPAQTAGEPLASRWITLGTQGGPIPLPTRSQPANVLVTGDGAYVIDAGDGVAEQLAKAGVPLDTVKAVVLSHLHFDHTAGLFGIISLRWQTSIYSPLAPDHLRPAGHQAVGRRYSCLDAARSCRRLCLPERVQAAV